MSIKRITRRKFLELMGIGIGAAGTAQFMPLGKTIPDAKAAAKVKTPPDQLMRQKLAKSTFDCSKYKKDPPWRLAFVTQGKTNSWVVMFDAHVDYAVQVKYKGLFSDFFYGDSQGNAERQLDVYEDALVWRPDVMLLAPMGQAAISASVDETMEMGIPIIYNSSRAESDNFVTWVEASNYRQGAVFAEWLAKKMNYKGKYIALSGIAGLSVVEDRLRGARDVFSQYPGIEELGQAYCDFSPAKGKQVTEAFLAAHPKIDAVWSGSGLQCWGAIEAFVEAGRDIPPVSGEDLNGFLRICKKYNVDFIAVNYPVEIGLHAVDAVVKTMRGETVPRYIDVPIVKFGKKDIDKYLRPDLSDDYWAIHKLPEDWIQKLGFKKK
ncbi:MAG: substrate-binding domain-containing protein [Desulfobacterales bacterium]|nr:MAG: substrate-binding domain-containing protein [Desulfobacterales bacterium]